MKRLLALMMILAPMMLGAQNRSSFECGGGVSFPGEMTLDYGGGSNQRFAANLYGEYRYQLWKGFHLGVQYQLMPEWSQVMEEDNNEKTLRSFSYLTHTLNALAEYRMFYSKNVSPFIGVGAGPQYQHGLSGESRPWKEWGLDLHARTGVELFHHLRLTVGHLHYSSRVFRAAQPAYYFSAGWVF